jgi:hypothetical protein
MGANNTPDVRVRLSAEGVQEVVNAFRQIANESRDSSRKTEQSVGLLTKLKLSEWALKAAEYVKEFATASLDAQVQISTLTRKTGLSAPVLSVLSRMAQLADGNLGDLEKSVKKLDTAIDQLSFGDSHTKNIFSRLGIGAKDLIGLNADQKFITVATALGKVADEGERSAIATELFGKSSGTLLLIADELAQRGFPALAEETKRLHQSFDQRTVDDAEKFKNTLVSMKLEAQALAGKALVGLSNMLSEIDGKLRSIDFTFVDGVGAIPTFTPPKTEKADAPTNEPKPFQFDGLIKSLQKSDADRKKFNIVQLADESKHAAALAKVRADAAKAGADHILALRQSELSREQTLDDGAFAQGLMSIDTYYARRADRINAGLAAETTALTAKRTAAGKENQAELAVIDSEIAKQKALNGAAADTRDLVAQRNQIELAGRTKIQAIDNQIQEVTAKAEGERTQNTVNRFAAERDLGRERLTLEQRIADAQGDTYTAAIKGIRLEAEELAKALHTTVDDPKIQQLIALLKGQALADNFARQFQSQQRAFSINTNALDLMQGGLQNKVASGQMFPAEAQAAYTRAVMAQLPALQQQLDLLKQSAQAELDAATTALNSALATGQDTTAKRDAVTAAMEHVQALEQEQQKLDQTRTAADYTAQQMGFLKTSVEEAIKTDLAGWLSSGIDEATSFGDAMRSLALSIVQSVRAAVAQVIANLLVLKLIQAITGKKDDGIQSAAPKLILGSIFMAIGGKIVAQAASQLQQAAIELAAAAMLLIVANSMSGGGGGLMLSGGGSVHGPGTSTSDSIPARLSDGEYVVQASAVRRVGVHTLDAINRGLRPAMVDRMSGAHFADGGFVDVTGRGSRASGMSGVAGLSATLDIDPVLILKRIEATSEWHKVYVRTAENNRKGMHAVLGTK